MEGIDVAGFLAHIAGYNESIALEVPFDPNVEDGRGTREISPPKSNWAHRLDPPPYEA